MDMKSQPLAWLVDVGNTATKWAPCLSSGLGVIHSMPTSRVTATSLLHRLKPQAPLIVASVVPDITKNLRAIRPRPLLLDASQMKGFTVATAQPRKTGADRLAACAGALHLAQPPLLIVQVGTTLTTNYLDAERRFLGGSIAPGPALMARSLSEGTAALPLVTSFEADFPVGASTREAIQNGIRAACVGAIQLLFQKLSAQNSRPLTLFLTGGGAPALLPDLPPETRHQPDLVLLGLATFCQSSSGRDQRGVSKECRVD